VIVLQLPEFVFKGSETMPGQSLITTVMKNTVREELKVNVVVSCPSHAEHSHRGLTVSLV
jgi:hypothetical protein